MRNSRDDATADHIGQSQTLPAEETSLAPRATNYPALPGWREPTTSREAAHRVACCAEVVRARVVGLLAAVPEGLSVHEIAARMRLPVSSVAPRISQLRNDGRIKPSGRRRRNAS